MEIARDSEGMKVAIRTDASVQIGSGHVMRCLTLAEELRTRGASVTFISRDHQGNLCDHIRRLEFSVVVLPPQNGRVDDGKLSHAHWLGGTWADDAAACIEAFEDASMWDWLIVDHYALDRRWESQLRRRFKRIFVIDDLADRAHECEVLLDQNLHIGWATRYDRLIPKSCCTLLGPEFALLRQEFRKVRAHVSGREGDVRRILVFFGGADPSNETGKALRAIEQLKRDDIAVDVIVGGQNPKRDEIAVQCKKLPKTRFLFQVSDMAEYMAKADLAIGGAGITTWERCCVGLPALVVAIADNQRSIAEGAAAGGLLTYVGDSDHVTSDTLAYALHSSLSQPQQIRNQSLKGMARVDGSGAARVGQVIFQ